MTNEDKIELMARAMWERTRVPTTDRTWDDELTPTIKLIYRLDAAAALSALNAAAGGVE